MSRLSLITVVTLGAVALALVANAGEPDASAASAMRATRSLAPLAAGALSVHDPFASDDCKACHASNDKDAPGPVADTSNALCLTCHEDPGVANDAPLKHQHGGADARCLDCHNPHNAMAETLLHAPIGRLCAECHADKRRGAVEHAPLATPESCTKCHTPHGSDEPALLASAFSSAFYTPYQRSAYALCFSCHEAGLVEAARTTTATGFRDGDLNLHTVHVLRDKGRSCGVCHDLHAGTGAQLVHDSVAFGSHGWRLPIGFKSTDTGGGCAKSCHIERAYDRTHERAPPGPAAPR